MTDIQTKLWDLCDSTYADFQRNLTPTLTKDVFIGVRVPVLRAFAKTLEKEEIERFLSDLPHKYYDENMLHSILLTKEKDFDKALEKVEDFLPYVDNWAVCDTLRPKAFEKNTDKLLEKIPVWVADSHVYTCRFGIEMLMNFYLDEHFDGRALSLPATVRSEEYYVNMMLAWHYATALAKQWKKTLPYLTGNVLSPWVHNKTIQKARESFRITPAQKEYLLTLKR